MKEKQKDQHFFNNFVDQISQRGYLTPKIQEFLSSFEDSLPTDALRDQLSGFVIAFSQDRDHPLQSFYLVNSLLHEFDFSPEVYQKVGAYLVDFLETRYQQEALSYAEYDEDARAMSWGILSDYISRFDDATRSRIARLILSSAKFPQENALIQSYRDIIMQRLSKQEES